MKIIAATPVLDTNIFAAGDALGGLLTFDLGRGSNIKTTMLKRAELLDDHASPVSADIDLHLFTDPAFVGTEQAAYSLTKAQYKSGNYLGPINFVTYAATVAGTNAGALVAIRDALDRILPVGPKGKIYGQLVVRAGTPTFAAAQLDVLLHFADYA
jgi:hypothetical protein